MANTGNKKMYTTDMLVTEIREHMLTVFVTNEWHGSHTMSAGMLADNAANAYRQDTHGDMVTPLWLKNVAADIVATPIFMPRQRVMLVGDEYTMERYHEGETVLPAGSVGVVYDFEPQAGILHYFVDFGTVSLLIAESNLTSV